MTPCAIIFLFAVDKDEGNLLQETAGQLHGSHLKSKLFSAEIYNFNL